MSPPLDNQSQPRSREQTSIAAARGLVLARSKFEGADQGDKSSIHRPRLSSIEERLQRREG